MSLGGWVGGWMGVGSERIPKFMIVDVVVGRIGYSRRLARAV